jgi:ribosomal-protein-alanine N-acetyltransferase
MMDVTTRRFKERDYNSVCSLNGMRVAGGYHGDVFIRQASVLFPQTFLVAEGGGDIIGFTIGAHEQEKPVNAWILRLGVRETCRRKKVGERLLIDLIGIFRDQGVKGIYLSVSLENDPAIGLYEKHGFHITDKMDGYFGQDEPRYIMRRILP